MRPASRWPSKAIDSGCAVVNDAMITYGVTEAPFGGSKDSGIGSSLELKGATVCVLTGTTTELNLADYFRVNNMKYEPVPIETNEEARKNYAAALARSRCKDADSRSTFAASQLPSRSRPTEPTPARNSSVSRFPTVPLLPTLAVTKGLLAFAIAH